jgi:hypothetical protein
MDEIANNLRSLKMLGMANFWTSLHETRHDWCLGVTPTKRQGVTIHVMGGHPFH